MVVVAKHLNHHEEERKKNDWIMGGLITFFLLNHLANRRVCFFKGFLALVGVRILQLLASPGQFSAYHKGIFRSRVTLG